MKKKLIVKGIVIALVLSVVSLAAAALAGETPVGILAGTGSHGAADGVPAQFNLPSGIFSGADGRIYVADTYNNLIRRINAGGSVQTLTGGILALDEFRFPRGFHRDGVLGDALFNRPSSGVVCPIGNIYIADSANHAIRMVSGGNVYTFAGGAAGFADGNIGAALFNFPAGVAFGPCGSLYVADTLNHVIRRIDAAGNVTTVAGTPRTAGFADGEAAEALFNAPMGLTVSESGVIFVADTNNHLIRVIEGGEVSTLAGALVFPGDIDWYDHENVDFDDAPIGGFANGTGTAAMFNLPADLALWGDTLIVADSANHMIRAVAPGGRVTTLAGTGYPDYLHMPRGVYVRGNDLIIADTGNNMIRIMPLAAETESETAAE